MAAEVEVPGVEVSGSAHPLHHDSEHVLRSVQDGRKALRRATAALVFSMISATGAWTNFGVTVWRAIHH